MSTNNFSLTTEPQARNVAVTLFGTEKMNMDLVINNVIDYINENPLTKHQANLLSQYQSNDIEIDEVRDGFKDLYKKVNSSYNEVHTAALNNDITNFEFAPDPVKLNTDNIYGKITETDNADKNVIGYTGNNDSNNNGVNNNDDGDDNEGDDNDGDVAGLNEIINDNFHSIELSEINPSFIMENSEEVSINALNFEKSKSNAPTEINPSEMTEVSEVGSLNDSMLENSHSNLPAEINPSFMTDSEKHETKKRFEAKMPIENNNKYSIKHHPLLKKYPESNDAEKLALWNDFQKNGIRHGVLTYKKQLIDGRYRIECAKKLKINFQIIEWEGDESELLSFLDSIHILKKDLTATQRAFLAFENISRFKICGNIAAKKQQLEGSK
jgi:hypothetical protein